MKRTLTVTIALLALASCSVEQRLAETAAEVEQLFAEARAWEQLPLRTISWHQAISMIYNNNHELKKIDLNIERCERDGLSIYTDMIPGVSYYGYLTKSINDLAKQYSTDDITSNINVTFNLPTITNIPYRVYAAHASTFAAIKSREAKERELMSKLYMNARKRELTVRLRELEASAPDVKEQDRMLAVSKQRTEDAAFWKTMSELLGDSTARWQILPESLPRVKWSYYEKKLSTLDTLTVYRFAIQLEQARMSQYNVAIQYLPTINSNIYSPSLFSSTGGTYQGTFLDGEQTKLNLNVSYTLDTKLSNWNSYQDSKAKYEMAQREVSVAVMDHKQKLLQLQQSVHDYNSWRSYMHKRLDYTQQMPVSTADEHISRDKAIFDMKKELISQEIASVESEAAVVLEYGFPE